MKFTRMLSALFIAASLVLGMHSAASADQLQDIKARGTLRVAIPQDYPPFGFMGPDKQLKGYDIEMAGIVAKALGVKCELVPVTGANRIPFLLSNRADIVISTLGKTKERQKVIDFSIAYAATYSGVFGPEKMNVTKPEDLKGHTISVTRGCIEDQLISVTFIVGSALAAIGGVLIASHMGQINFFIGFLAGMKAFTAAVLGGIGSVPGAVLGGLVLGLAESFTTGYIAGNYEDVLSFCLLILILIFRPDGLLGKKQVQKV